MKTRVDDALRSEAARFRLRFTCGDCAHFVPDRRACAHGYPTEPHRDVALEQVADLEFCKEFELV